MRKPLPGQFVGPVEKPFSDRGFAETYPHLHDYLTCTTWDGGQLRTTSTLLFFVEQGVLKCCINDRDNSRSAFVSAVRFEELLRELDDRLGSETLDWRMKSSRSPGGPTPF